MISGLAVLGFRATVMVTYWLPRALALPLLDKAADLVLGKDELGDYKSPTR